jgi:hypothetical protein
LTRALTSSPEQILMMSRAASASRMNSEFSITLPKASRKAATIAGGVPGGARNGRPYCCRLFPC